MVVRGGARFGLVTQVSTGEAWWSMVRCGAFWFVNAGQGAFGESRFGGVRYGDVGQVSSREFR